MSGRANPTEVPGGFGIEKWRAKEKLPFEHVFHKEEKLPKAAF
jgi:hypothetical protein